MPAFQGVVNGFPVLRSLGSGSPSWVHVGNAQGSFSNAGACAPPQKLKCNLSEVWPIYRGSLNAPAYSTTAVLRFPASCQA